MTVHARLAALGLLAGAATAAAAFTPTQLVTFGDSFVDAGAVARFTGGIVPDASLGYFQGRFSEGPTWVDWLSLANLGTLSIPFNIANPAFTLPPPFTPGATNFAVGGARASFDDVTPLGVVPSLPSQLGFYAGYLAFTGQAVDPGALYIINFGNNDVNAILATPDPLERVEIANAYVANMAGAVLALSGAGARHILVAGVPNPTNPVGVALQAALDAELDRVQLALPPEASLTRFDYFGFFTALAADPTRFGLPADLDLVTPCLAAVPPGPGIDCTGFLSFDGTHVTAAVQKAISVQVGRQLGIAVVPEPATWALLVAGFGLVGGALRRRRPGAAIS
jgi:phospholipase/lecithinase/hemolysin